MDLADKFKERMQKQLSGEWQAFQQSLQETPPVSIRLNPLKKIDFQGEKTPWCSKGIYLSENKKFIIDPLWHAGCYYVQEASSMFIEHVLNFLYPTPSRLPGTILDLCAAPGGKTTLLATHAEKSLIIANETIRSRTGMLVENVIKSGISNVAVINNDPKELGKLNARFDLILVDAPCSGEGLFRKNPRSVTTWTPQSLELCASRQKRIFFDIWEALKPGGHLIYSTCTFNPEENENNLADWHKKCAFDSIEIPSPEDWKIHPIKKDRIFGYYFYPHRVKGEGFFISILQKHSQPSTNKNPDKKNKNPFFPPEKSWKEKIRPWIKTEAIETRKLMKHENLIYALDPRHAERLMDLTLPKSPLYQGTLLGEIKKDLFIPAHALALSHILSESIPNTGLQLHEALNYLRRHPISPNENTGWETVSFQNQRLGWVKRFKNRVNINYPKNYAIKNY